MAIIRAPEIYKHFDMNRSLLLSLILLISCQAGAEESAEEIAQKLANPNTPLASLNFKLQYRSFEGDLPDARDQSGTMLLFQPAFPFKLENGAQIFFRPAIPLIAEQPAYGNGNSAFVDGFTTSGFDNPANEASGFDEVSGIGDIAFDLAYGRTTASGILWAGGVISTLPTATKDELGNDRFTLGPEFLIGKLTKKYVIGAFPNHQWDVGGSGDKDISLSTVQFFGTYLPGGGWNIGTAPIITYDHISDELTLPINITFGKTIIAGGSPWKVGMEINYYLEKPDAFGPEWMIGFNVSPVIKNPFSKWFQ